MTYLARLQADLAEIDAEITSLRAAVADAADAKSHSEAFGAHSHTNQDIDALMAQITKLRQERRALQSEINAIQGTPSGATTLGVTY